MKKVLHRSERGLAFLLALLMAVFSPTGVLAANLVVTEVKDDGKDLDYIITEKVPEDDSAADVRLDVIEKNAKSENIVTTFEELKTAIAGADDGDTIRLEGTIYLTGQLTISKSITLTGGTLIRDINFHKTFIMFGNNVDFTLKDIILDGNKENGAYGEMEQLTGGGFLFIKNKRNVHIQTQGNVIFQNNLIKSTNGASGGVIASVSAIGGTLTINDGTVIQNNECEDMYIGGLMYLEGFDFTMNGGVIQNNTTNEKDNLSFANIYVTGTAEYLGGKIINNIIQSDPDKISENYDEYSGGTIIVDNTLETYIGNNMIISDNFAQLADGSLVENNIYCGNRMEAGGQLYFEESFSGKVGITVAPNSIPIEVYANTATIIGESQFFPNNVQSKVGAGAFIYSDREEYISRYESNGTDNIIAIGHPKVTYDTREGEFALGEKKEFYTTTNQPITKPTDPTFTDHTFVSWYTTPDCQGGTQFDFNTPITKDITLYAGWHLDVYFIDFDPNGGTGMMDTIMQNGVETVTLPQNTFTNGAYLFDRWNTEADGSGTDVADGQEFTGGKKNVTLYAQWTMKTYTVTFAVNSGELGGSLDGDTTAQTVAYGEYPVKTAGVKVNNGSAFLGWSFSYIPEGGTEPVSGTVSDYTTVPITADVTFTAQFAKIPFVSGISTGGYIKAQKGTDAPTDVGSDTTTKIEYDADELPAEAWFKFKGVEHYHIEAITFTDLADREFTVNIDSKAAQTFTVGDTIDDTADIELTVDKADSILHITGIVDSLQFTFTFVEDIKYKVEFFQVKDAPDSLMQTNDGLYAGDPVGDKPKADPERPGCKFLGWSTDGTNTPEKMYDKDTRIADADIAYYGVWELIDYNLDISNTVEGAYGNRNKNFHFTITLKDADGKPLSGIYHYTGAAIPGVAAPADGVLTLDASGQAEFTLKHGQSILVKGIHIGEQYEVVEREADQNGYVTTSTGEKNFSVTADQSASFTNIRIMSPPTGITDEDHWLMLLLGIPLLTYIRMLWARRRKHT